MVERECAGGHGEDQRQGDESAHAGPRHEQDLLEAQGGCQVRAARAAINEVKQVHPHPAHGKRHEGEDDAHEDGMEDIRTHRADGVIG